ncbi:PspC domain protein [compost metagenome]
MGRLYRSRRDRCFSGLLGGLGESFGISTTLLRLLFVFSIFFTGGTTLFIYLIASLVVSKEPYIPHDPYYNRGWQGGYQGCGQGGYGGGHRDSSYGGPHFGGSHYGESQYSDPRHGEQRNRQQAGFGGSDSNLDSMMKDIEKKAMEKELEELRRKLSKYENEKGDK